MARPTIQYTNTSDGVRIAFHVLGNGPAVAILFPYHVNHLTLNWQVPLHRRALECLARRFTVINLDFRGAGVSERSVSSLSLATFVEDLRAVLAHLGIEHVALCAMGDASLIACHFASMWPNRVLSMAFIGAGDSETNRRVLSLRHVNPALEARLRGALLGGLEDEENASALAAVAREALNSDALTLWEQMLHENRLRPLASGLAGPTLWLHAANDQLVAVQDLQALVETMCNATIVTFPGKSGMDVWRDRLTVQAMTLFLARGFGIEDSVVHAQPKRRSRITAYPASLSQREVEVLRRVVAGRTSRQISEDLFISPNTVSYHLRNIFNKTGARNRTEAASFAHRHGLSADLAQT